LKRLKIGWGCVSLSEVDYARIQRWLARVNDFDQIEKSM